MRLHQCIYHNEDSYCDFKVERFTHFHVPEHAFTYQIPFNPCLYAFRKKHKRIALYNLRTYNSIWPLDIGCPCNILNISSFNSTLYEPMLRPGSLACTFRIIDSHEHQQHLQLNAKSRNHYKQWGQPHTIFMQGHIHNTSGVTQCSLKLFNEKSLLKYIILYILSDEVFGGTRVAFDNC